MAEMSHGAPDNATWYEVDAKDRVTAVCPEWDAIAQREGGTVNARRGGVIGQPLSRFISGDVSRMYMDAALQAARVTGQPRTLRYRCDSPTKRRSLEMTLTPLGQGGVRIEHRLVEEQHRPRSLDVRTEAPSLEESSRTVWRCSVCLRLRRIEGDWQEPDAVPSTPEPVDVRYTICAGCRLG